MEPRPSRGSPSPVVAPWVRLGAPAVQPAMEPEVLDNFWHNDLFARICSTCGGGEWRYLVDLPVNLTSHLALFRLLAFGLLATVWLNHIHSDSQPINIIIECLGLDLCISRALRILPLLDDL